MNDEALKDFILVGGTALSLQIGHRQSFDLDLFTQNHFDSMALGEHLSRQYHFQTSSIKNGTTLGKIKDIKTDFIRHSYTNIEPVVHIKDIRMASLADISAMKLNAIVQNGTRLKDFIDIAFLSSHISFRKMVNSYVRKYEIVNSIMAIKGLAYFDDINFKEPIYLLHHKLNWEVVKKRLTLMVKEPEKIFAPLVMPPK